MTGPVLGPAVHAAADQLGRGGAQLARAGGRWLWPAELPPPPAEPAADAGGEAEDDRNAAPVVVERDWRYEWALLRLRAGRIAGLVAAGYFGGHAAVASLDAEPRLMWPLAAGGLVACWRAGAEQHDQDVVEFVELTTAEFLELLRELLPDGPGVHLVEVAARLDEEAPRPAPWTTGAVRLLARDAGLPVVSTRSRTRDGASTGIRRKDLPDPSPTSESAPVGVVVPGQADDSDSDNRGDVLIIHDPTDPAGRRQAVPRRAAR